MATTRMPLPEVIDIASPIIERVVWATVATVGPDRRPRTRLMHPVWFWPGNDGTASDIDVPTALVSARPTPLKLAHLAAQAQVSCFYWDPRHDTVAVDAVAEWVESHGRSAAWDKIKAVPEPVGFDPAIIWPTGSDSDDCAFLRLTARRIVASRVGQPAVRWTG